MLVLVGIVGAAAEAIAWWLIASRGRDLWRLMPPVLVAMAVAAWIAHPPRLAVDVGVGEALAVGIGAGLLLYVATRLFVTVAIRWEPFARATRAIYGEARPIPLALAIGLSVLVMVPAEEVFWRGFVQAELGAAWGPAWAAATTWALFVAVNVPSRSLPIVLGAAVGGAVWAALGWWSGGMLASLASHILWTGLMLGLPPRPGREVLLA